jgi:serine/threonine protein kinase/Tfp pilus assembly protein PilF
VEALLPGNARAAGSKLSTLPKFAAPAAASDPAAASRFQPGARVGPYELIRLLGAGGMAQVWLSRRADGAFKREVALKLPHPNSHRPDLAQRFARERDILAALEHPYIARLYDAGVDSDGSPYLSMEYVQGEALLDWCDTRQLAIVARLELFLKVLEAVQYAHARQVIHRDLKPSNILVTQAGQVRLLDFGVAKLLESDGPEQTQLTEVHGRALTPDYASPELLQGDPVDERCDVYSLGVLLYELLTGARPYKLNSAASTGPTRQLRGDLDAIALRALARESGQRYPTVHGLAQDLRRYLNGEPIQAQSPRFAYRAGKLIQRHKTAIAAITAAAAVVLIMVGYTLRREGDTTEQGSAATLQLETGGGPEAAQESAAGPGPTVASGTSVTPFPRPPADPFGPSSHSVAVLPFLDLSESQDQEYFSDGLTEELLDLLAKVPDLQVIARTSSFSFKGKSDDIPTIARRLNVANILEGSVRKSGRRLRVTTHLIRATTGEELWSETYDRELKDVFQVQDEIAAAVTGALKLKLTAGQRAVNTRHTSNTEAYNQYLLGRQFYQRDTRENEELAIKAFRKAIRLDPGYAAAYAGLAKSQNELAMINGNEAPLRAQVVAAASKAIALAPGEAGGYVARAELRLYVLWDWKGAQADLEKALANEPADSAAVREYGNLLAAIGRMPEGIVALRHATELDPLSARAWNYLGVVLTHGGQFPAANDAFSRALEIQPTSQYIPFGLGTLELQEGRASQALETFRGMPHNAYRPAGIALAEQALGHAGESQQALDELIAKFADEAAYQIAEVYARRSDNDQAFAWLERAYRQRDAGLTAIKVDRVLAPLHSDARFGAMLAKLHLP